MRVELIRKLFLAPAILIAVAFFPLGFFWLGYLLGKHQRVRLAITAMPRMMEDSNSDSYLEV